MEIEKDKFQKIIKTFKSNLDIYAKNCLNIINKDGKSVPLVFNAAQMELDRLINEQYSHHNRVRMLILKSRQTGISTYCQARGFWKTVSAQNQNAVVVSHLNESTKAIFGMVRYFYDNLPHPLVKPDLKNPPPHRSNLPMDPGGVLLPQEQVRLGGVGQRTICTDLRLLSTPMRTLSPACSRRCPKITLRYF